MQGFAGTILVYDRAGRSAIVEAFRRAGWKAGKQYYYVARQRMGGGEIAEACYMTEATVADLARLYAVFRSLPSDVGGFESYAEEKHVGDVKYFDGSGS